MKNQESEDRSSAPATSFPGFAPSRGRSESEHWERGRRAEVKPPLTLQVLTTRVNCFASCVEQWVRFLFDWFHFFVFPRMTVGLDRR